MARNFSEIFGTGVAANDIYEMKIEPGKSRSRKTTRTSCHMKCLLLFLFTDVVLAKNGGEETKSNGRISKEEEGEREEKKEKEVSLSEPFLKRQRMPERKDEEKADTVKVKQEAPDEEGDDNSPPSPPPSRPHLTLPAPPTKPAGEKMVFLQPRSRSTTEATEAK